MRTAENVCVSFCLLVSASTPVLAAEGRTPIYAPTVINASGKYVVTRNISGTGGTPAIQISANSVDLDLNGFVIDGGGSAGIQVLGGDEVRIHGGSIYNATVGVRFGPAGVYRSVLEDLNIHVPTVAGIRIDETNNFAIRRVLVSNGFPATGKIESCQLSGGGGQGISIGGGSSVTIEGNTVAGFTQEGIILDTCQSCLVKDNSVSLSGGNGGIYLNSAVGTSVVNNVSSVNRSNGIHLGSQARSTLVQNNVMSKNGSNPNPADGLRVDGWGAVIVGNTMNENFGIGLHLSSTSGLCTIGRNTARLNGGGAPAVCGGPPVLFFPDSCNGSAAGHSTFGDNLIPGPPPF
jgi:parallel beta-helix repeat protein